MLQGARSRLSFANVMSLVAVFIALGGTAFAVKQIGSKQIQNNGIKGVDVKDHNLTAKDIDESTLANSRVTSRDQGGGTTAPIPDTLGSFPNPISGLDLKAGRYLILATLVAHDDDDPQPIPAGQCRLAAGADSYTVSWDVLAGAGSNEEPLTLQLAHSFSAPGPVNLSCADNTPLAIGSVGDIKLTAVRVASVSNGNLATR